jgi:hypothetical protein
MVDILVGPQRRLFRVHKSFLCNRIPYFDKMFNSGFIEASENKATLSEDDPDSFDVLIDWAYTGTLRPLERDKKRGYNWEPIPFYILVEKMCLPKLMDQVMDAYRAGQKRRSSFMPFDTAQICYKTQEHSSIRRYAVHSLVHIFLHSIRDDLWSISGFQNLIKTNDDLGKDFLVLLKAQSSKALTDPRCEDNCAYHCHKADEECPAKKVNQTN